MRRLTGTGRRGVFGAMRRGRASFDPAEAAAARHTVAAFLLATFFWGLPLCKLWDAASALLRALTRGMDYVAQS